MNAAEHAAAVLSFEIKRRTHDEQLANAIFELMAAANILENARGDTKKFRILSAKFEAEWPAND